MRGSKLNAIDGVIYLARCAVNEIVPDSEIVESLDLDAVYQESSRHMITAAVGMSLMEAGISTPAFKQAIAKAQRKAVVLSYEMQSVFAQLKAAEIWYMPLKGSVLRDWYPKFAMREMADCDVLFDASKAEEVRTIMTAFGYEVKEFDNSIHDVYLKKPTSNFEMHKALMDPSYGKLLYEYYKDVSNRLIGEEYDKQFKTEDFYIYSLAHEYKHYSAGGTGLRSLLDTYVVLKHFDDLDWDYIKGELEKLGIEAFEHDNRILAEELFSLGEHAISNHEMLAYVIGSGTYGTLQNKVENDVGKYGTGISGKTKYLFHRVFIPLKDVKKSFPVFYKYKILLPLLPFYRFMKGKNRAKFKMEMKALRNK